jgi:hypothetical protein
MNDRRSPVDVYNTYNRTPSVADPILSGFKDDLFNLEMENTAYESLKSSLPLPMDNSLDAYRLKNEITRTKIRGSVQADGSGRIRR